MQEGSDFSTSLSTLILGCLLRKPTQWVSYLTMVLMCISPVGKAVEHIHVLTGYLYSFLTGMSIRILGLLFNSISCLLVIELRSKASS